ncbi:thioredoxin family protein [Caulobacter segnis]
MAPHFETAALQLEPAARLLKLDSDAEQAAAGALNVSSIPTLILFRDGQPIARLAGAMSASQIVDWTKRALG